MAKFDEINGARKLFRLGETATLKEIRNVYRRMGSRYHPDKHTGGVHGKVAQKLVQQHLDK